MNLRLVVVAAILAGIVVAGCTGSSPPKAVSTGPTVPVGATSGADSEGGTIVGSVVDDEGRPVSGAKVAVIDQKLEVVTPANGSFEFRDVPAGKQRVFAQALGYEPGARQVDVVAGETTPEVKFILTPIATVVAFNETKTYDGYMTCGILLVPWCGTLQDLGDEGVQTTGEKWVFNWTFKDNKYPMTEVYELVWTPSTAGHAARLEPLYFTSDDSDPTASYTIATGGGGSPLRLAVAADKLEAAHKAYPASDFVFGVYPPLDEPVVNQKFTIYRTLFWGEEAPEGWTFYKPA